MELSFTQIANGKIFYNKKNCGFLKGLKIDKDTGKVASLINYKNQCFQADFVVDWQVPLKLSSIEKCGKEGSDWINFRVFTRDGKYLGFVTDYYFEINTLQISRIVINKSFFGIFRYAKRIISSKLIFNVKDKKIIVDADMRNLKLELAEMF